MYRRRHSNRKLDERLGLPRRQAKTELEVGKSAVSLHASHKKELGPSKRRRKSGTDLGELRNNILAVSELQRRRSFSGLGGRNHKLRRRSRNGLGEEVCRENSRRRSSSRGLDEPLPTSPMLQVDSRSRSEERIGLRAARSGNSLALMAEGGSKSVQTKKKRSVSSMSRQRRRSFGMPFGMLPRMKRTDRDSKGTQKACPTHQQGSSHQSVTSSARKRTSGRRGPPLRRSRRGSWGSQAGSESHSSHGPDCNAEVGWEDSTSRRSQSGAKVVSTRARARRRRSSFRDILHVFSGTIDGSVPNRTAPSRLDNKEYPNRHRLKRSRRRMSFRDLADAVMRSTGVVGTAPSSESCGNSGEEELSESSDVSFLRDSPEAKSNDCPDYVTETGFARGLGTQSTSQTRRIEDCDPFTMPLESNLGMTRSKRSSSKSNAAARHMQTNRASRRSPDDANAAGKKGSAKKRQRSSRERDSGVSKLVGAGLRSMRTSFRVPIIESALGMECSVAKTTPQEDELEWKVAPDLTIVSPTCRALLEKQESWRSIRSSIVEGEHQLSISPRSDGRAFSNSESAPQKLETPMLDMGFEIDRGGTTRRSSKQIVLPPMMHDLLEQAQVDGDANKRSFSRKKPANDGGKGSKRDLFAGGEADCIPLASMLRNRRLSGRCLSLAKDEDDGGTRTPSKQFSVNQLLK